MIGWEVARSNAAPSLIIQGITFVLLIAYYTNRAVFSALNQLADYKRSHGLVFVIATSITAGALASTTATNLSGLRGQRFPQRLRIG